MPRIARLTTVSIYIRADDHAPPHFHAHGPDTDMQVSIGTLQVMRGHYTRAALAETIAWAAKSQPLLWTKWDEINERD
jgi:hypothetical protein